jgi:hypothetical protein
MIENIKLYAEQIISDCEDIQADDYESAYRKEKAVCQAYVDIVELVKGGD